MNVEKQINKLKERVKELERLVGVEENVVIEVDSESANDIQEFTTWVDDEEPERESAVDIVHRLLGR